MKSEMKWITLWIMTCCAMSLLSLTYFYFNGEFEKYMYMIVGITSLSILLPYALWKYKQIRFVEKRTITIQILQD